MKILVQIKFKNLGPMARKMFGVIDIEMIAMMEIQWSELALFCNKSQHGITLFIDGEDPHEKTITPRTKREIYVEIIRPITKWYGEDMTAVRFFASPIPMCRPARIDGNFIEFVKAAHRSVNVQVVTKLHGISPQDMEMNLKKSKVIEDYKCLGAK